MNIPEKNHNPARWYQWIKDFLKKVLKKKVTGLKVNLQLIQPFISWLPVFTVKRVQHKQDILSISGFTNPNKRHLSELVHLIINEHVKWGGVSGM